MYIRAAAVGLGAMLALRLPSQAPPRISDIDRVRIREAYHLAAALGDRIWPTWHDAPFALLLVTPDHEFLVHHSNPSPEFTKIDGDTLVGEAVYYRKRVFSTGMQATFPAVNGVNTIVIGQAERTSDRHSTRWVLTVLHEHFHQFVYSQPGYYAGVAALGLAHGDESGMWMLNYPFPYDSVRTQEKFAHMTHALADALTAAPPQVGPSAPQARVAAFRQAVGEFRESVPAEAQKYFAFQLWQEGTARYTELMLGELAAQGYSPTTEFAALPDFTPYKDVAAALRAGIMRDLGALSLEKSRREVVYSVGAAQALLLDRVQPAWRRVYLTERFRLPDPE